jgi:hypothetical protein
MRLGVHGVFKLLKVKEGLAEVVHHLVVLLIEEVRQSEREDAQIIELDHIGYQSYVGDE